MGLLGTKVTMTEDFYQRRLKDRYNIEVFVPKKGEQKLLHKIIFDELTYGQIHDNSRKSLIEIIDRLSSKDCEGVILGCTEVTLLIEQKDTKVPLLDTTRLHAKAAVDADI